MRSIGQEDSAASWTNLSRNLTLLVCSYVFYSWGAPKTVPLLFIASLADYLIVKKTSLNRIWLGISISYNLGILLYYKYTNFFLETLRGQDHVALSIILPVGISFFTFQKISFLLDVHSKRADKPRSFLDYALFVACFPQLIAGPIVRFHDIAKQLRSRTHSVALAYTGASLFIVGLAKKVLLANPMGEVCDTILATNIGALSGFHIILAILTYSQQIYFDFSGYSDMAIGLGLIFGFKFPENFNRPYQSASVTEFWRRWHITLGEWMRLYLYIPLGGNRRGVFRTYLNLWLVFLLSGLWHGASWNFVIWGALHGLALVVERLSRGSSIASILPKPLKVLLTFSFVCLAWLFFRVENTSVTIDLLTRIFTAPSFWPDGSGNLILVELFDRRTLLAGLFCLCFSFLVPRFEKPLNGFFLITLFLLSALSLYNASFNPFIYFRF